MAETNEQLVERFQQGDRSALDQLVAQNLGAVRQEAGKIADRNNFDDAMQECYLTVMRCAELFDLSRGLKFSTYMIRAMHNRLAIWKYKDHVVYVPRGSVHQGNFRPLWNDAVDEGFFNYLVDPSPEFTAELEEREEHQRDRNRLRYRMVRRLNERQRYIVRQRWKGRHLQDLADELGLCKERVRQIECKAIRKLKEGAAA
jgi:RNA polymerase sigma factor (sigma-70 family)